MARRVLNRSITLSLVCRRFVQLCRRILLRRIGYMKDGFQAVRDHADVVGAATHVITARRTP